ncbi:MAG: ABC transporter permease subunit [Pirellulaceae bacterium]|nr:ABC transporter permease subunit [Pirellulaceae bacterium]
MNTAVFRRELLERLRASRTMASVLACALLSSLLVWLRWPTDSRLDIVSQGSMQVFGPLAYALAVAIFLLVPAFPATALVGERRRGTLALLLNSPLSRMEIYLGKLVSNFLLAALIVSVSLPALAACYAMGGLSAREQLLPLLAVLLAMSLQFSAVGLWVSSRAATSDSSLRWTYAAVLGLVVLSLAPSAIIGNVSSVLGFLARTLTLLSPLGALRELTSTDAATAELALSDNWLGYCVAAVLSSIVCAIGTLVALNPYRSDRPKPTGVMSHNRRQAGRIFRRLSYLVDPQSRKAGSPWWINPVMVKEFRTRKFGRLHWLIRLIAVCAIVSLTLTVISATGTVSWGVNRIAATLVLMQTSLLIVLGPSLAAGLIAAERETGGWQLLRMTPMYSIRIVVGKLMSVVWTMSLILLATLPGYLVMMWIQPSIAPQVQRVLLSLVLATVVIISVSAMVSAFWKNAAAATATSYGVLLALFAGTLLVWLARGKPFGAQLVERVLMFNPAAAALAEIRTPGFEEYTLLPISWWIGLGISATCLSILSIRTWQLTRPD